MLLICKQDFSPFIRIGLKMTVVTRADQVCVPDLKMATARKSKKIRYKICENNNELT